MVCLRNISVDTLHKGDTEDDDDDDDDDDNNNNNNNRVWNTGAGRCGSVGVDSRSRTG
jgi:hypothetical protein